jgi:F-type H+-transporting ATPase subunit a
LLIQVVGIRNKGLGFYKHLVIKPLGLGIPMLPFMLIDELARPVTLAMRLFGNIFAGEVLLVVSAAIIVAGIYVGPVPISKLANAAPLLIYGFNMIIGTIQAVVFTLLTIGYLVVPTEETEH